MTTLSRELLSAPAPTSAAVAPQPTTDVRPAPRWGHALWMLLWCAIVSLGCWTGLYALVTQSGLAGVFAAVLVVSGAAALLLESGVGEMPDQASAPIETCGCTVCGRVVPRAHASYDDVFGFVCEDCEVPEEAV